MLVDENKVNWVSHHFAIIVLIHTYQSVADLMGKDDRLP